MRRAERLYRLIDEMRTRSVVRADDLAETMEVSVRTIYRDVAHLQASGVPIDGEAGVGYVLRPGFELPSMTFTHDQVDALAVGLAIVESVGDVALSSAVREVRAKLQAAMPLPETRALADAPYRAPRMGTETRPHTATLRRAVRGRLVVRLDYTNAAGERSQRRVRPLVMWCLADGWMVSGWCETKHAHRTFRLDRISALEMTGDRFIDDAETGLAAFLHGDRCGDASTLR